MGSLLLAVKVKYNFPLLACVIQGSGVFMFVISRWEEFEVCLRAMVRSGAADVVTVGNEQILGDIVV